MPADRSSTGSQSFYLANALANAGGEVERDAGNNPGEGPNLEQEQLPLY
jgi:hypothetical protein